MRVVGMVVVAALAASTLAVTPSFASQVEAQAGTTSADLCDAEDVAAFGDVNTGDYGADYIGCMKALRLSAGKRDGTYGAGDSLTRAQMASFMVRLWRDVLNRQCPD